MIQTTPSLVETIGKFSKETRIAMSIMSHAAGGVVELEFEESFGRVEDKEGVLP